MPDQPTDWQTAFMVPRDLDAVRDIDELSGQWPEWAADRFTRELRKPEVIGITVHDAFFGPVAFAIYELGAGVVRVRRFAVHPDWQRRGIGREMARKLLGKITNGKQTRLAVYVPETLLPAGGYFWAAMGLPSHLVVGDDDGDPDTVVFRCSRELAKELLSQPVEAAEGDEA